jgi:hypothetical protein
MGNGKRVHFSNATKIATAINNISTPSPNIGLFGCKCRLCTEWCCVLGLFGAVRETGESSNHELQNLTLNKLLVHKKYMKKSRFNNIFK